MNFYRGLFIRLFVCAVMFGGSLWVYANWDDISQIATGGRAIERTIGEHNGFETEAELNKMRKLHRYHGTNYSWREHGKRWFYRGGRRCELWDPWITEEGS